MNFIIPIYGNYDMHSLLLSFLYVRQHYKGANKKDIDFILKGYILST